MNILIEKIKNLLPKYRVEKIMKDRERVMRAVFKSIEENRKSNK